MNDNADITTDEQQSNNNKYSERVLATIHDLCTTELCKPSVKLNEHINKLFPTEQSLSQLDGILAALEQEVDEFDNELAELVEAFGEAGETGTNALKLVSFYIKFYILFKNLLLNFQAKETLADLDKKMTKVRSRTQTSESSVLTMTRDIKQLDIAKKNLTSSITTLHHLHILLSGVNSLCKA